jgi:hypothetical protein
MSQLDRYGGSPSSSDTGGRDSLPAHLQRDLNRISDVTLRRVAIAQGQADESLVRTTAFGQIANTAMPMAASLSDLEARLTEAAPNGAHRYRAIADAFTAAVLDEILNLGIER